MDVQATPFITITLSEEEAKRLAIILNVSHLAWHDNGPPGVEELSNELWGKLSDIVDPDYNEADTHLERDKRDDVS